MLRRVDRLQETDATGGLAVPIGQRDTRAPQPDPASVLVLDPIFDHRSVAFDAVHWTHGIEARHILGVYTCYPFLTAMAQFCTAKADQPLAAEAIDLATDKVDLEHHAACGHGRMPE